MRGIVPPLVTPLTLTGDFDAESYRRLIERVIEGGVHGIFVMGSTGEFSSFSSEIRQTIVQESCRAARKRIPVVVNVSDTCLEHSLRLAEFSARAGADGVAICPPFYFSVTQCDLVRYLTKFANQAALPVFLYNIPQNAHHELTVETVERLADVPNIVGLKNSNGSLEYMSDVSRVKRHRPDFSILVGSEEIIVPAMEAGADGSVCGGANMFPRLFVELYDAIAGNRNSQARQIQEQVVRIAEALYTVGAPPTSYFRGLKAALAELGVCGETLAEPLAPFSSEETQELRSRLNCLLPDLT
ncbi:MAG: dihydrodipicolinate synthase family protein [Bryobacteraceae bacterium]